MSDNWLQLVPVDPRFRPSTEQAERARRLLELFLPRADEVSAETKDTIEFFDPGDNWSGVECPACGADAENWWTEALDRAGQANFEHLLCRAGCCGAEVSLNELRYAWPAAFGSFALIARNPVTEHLTLAQKLTLEQQLGCALRVVWTHR